MLKRLVYASRRLDAQDDTVRRIVEASRRHNAAEGVTGVLLHDPKLFVQFLEGDHDAIARCFLRIARSESHADIRIAGFGDSAVRLFTGWDMQDFEATRLRPSLQALWRRTMAKTRDARLPFFEAELIRMLPPGR